jgi:hypothetical protein
MLRVGPREVTQAELVEPEQVKHAHALMLDDSPAVRSAAAKLANTLLTTQAAASVEQHSASALAPPLHGSLHTGLWKQLSRVSTKLGYTRAGGTWAR